jgi:hypothetical protein
VTGRGQSQGRPLTRVILLDQLDDQGTRHLSASRDPNGGSRIDGQDLGPGVERAFGAGLSEYEWSWVIAPGAVPALFTALGGHDGEDPLILLATWSAARRGADPGSHFRDSGVPIAFWNRIGD